MPITNGSLIMEGQVPKRNPYQLYLPQEYESQNHSLYPLIVFLHGIRKRGDDLALLNDYGLTWIAERRKDFPFIVVTPQCPADSNWTLETDLVMAVTREITTTYRVASENIYLTGFSMGGRGTWDLASKHPEAFAAIVPVSGWYEVERAPLLKEMPIWAFHGEEDDVVAPSGSEEMVKALKSLGSTIRYTTYPGLKHFVMEETYGDPELYEWMLTHKRGKPG